MDMYHSMFSSQSRLNEQVARQIFEILPEKGPVVVITDSDGNCWPSDSDRFASLKINESFWQELRSKIDDGAEPVVSKLGDWGIVATQLATEKTNCGYVTIFLPKHSPEATLANIDLIEIVLGQINLVAKLIEKNCQLYELQMKHLPGTSAYVESSIAAN